MSCYSCGSYKPCNCVTQINYPCVPCSTPVTGCPIQLDSNCVIYHKDNNTTSLLLEGLNLNNGATLQLILETISAEILAINTTIEQLDFEDIDLPFLDPIYTITDLESFAIAVDSQFAAVDSAIADMGYLGATPVDLVLADVENGQYFYRTDTDVLRIKVNGVFRSIATTA